MRDHVNGQGKNNGRILLRADVVECLQEDCTQGPKLTLSLSFHSGKFGAKITCKYLNWRAEDESLMTSEASLSARLAFCSPSAAITLALASRAASASAAMALWS